MKDVINDRTGEWFESISEALEGALAGDTLNILPSVEPVERARFEALHKSMAGVFSRVTEDLLKLSGASGIRVEPCGKGRTRVLTVYEGGKR